jgi:hypothetical protein
MLIVSSSPLPGSGLHIYIYIILLTGAGNNHNIFIVATPQAAQQVCHLQQSGWCLGIPACDSLVIPSEPGLEDLK